MKQIRIESQEKAQQIMKETISYISVCVLAVLAMTCVLSLNYVPSESMEPTIHQKHLIVNWRLPYLIGDPMPVYGDIIIFRENGPQRRLLVKRVIGLPGDEIEITEGKVFRNGKELDESYLLAQESTYSAVPEYTVPEGSLFVLGDNRYKSRDSRFMEETFVPIQNIYARELWQFPISIPLFF